MRELLSDQGSSFKNKLIAQLCKLLNIKHRFSSPHHPQTDGKAERMVQTVIRSLKLICDTQTQWAEKLTPVLMSYRSTVSMAIGKSPYHALYGREMVTGIDANLLLDFSKSPNMQSYTLISQFAGSQRRDDRSNLRRPGLSKCVNIVWWLF